MLDIVTAAEQRWGLQFKRKTASEYSGPCPFCREGEDRFLIFDDGGFWCRQCGSKGWTREDNQRSMSGLERRVLKLENEQRQLERRQAEQERRLSALERMCRCKDHLLYHKNLNRNEDALGYWLAEGVTYETMDRYQLGYCSRCPTDIEGRPSYTIPVINGGKLVNIRHRLAGETGGDKYRPHMAGLGTQLFNADAIRDPRPEVLILEGAKKCIVVGQFGFDAVAIMGKRAFRPEWLERFERIRTVYVALDPDARESAQRLAAVFGKRGRVVDLPCKPDDMFVLYGATGDDLRAYLRVARPVDGRTQ